MKKENNLRKTVRSSAEKNPKRTVTSGFSSFFEISGYKLNDHARENCSLANVTYPEVLFTTKSNIGWLVPGFAYLSGVLLIVILTIMVICSSPCVRRSGYFQVSKMVPN